MTRAPCMVYQTYHDKEPDIASPSCLGEGWLYVGGIHFRTKNPASFGHTEAPAGPTCTPQGHPITSFTLIKNSLFSTARVAHVGWVPPSLPDSIVLLGGSANAAKLTAEIVPGGGTFDLHHSGYDACGIPDEDTIVMTGGYPSHDYVTRYNVNGFVEELPQLPGNRYGHACAALPSTKAFIVAGGKDGSNVLSSVLTLLPGAQAWTPLTSLPRRLYLARASTVGGKMRVAGGFTGFSRRSEVLEYQPEPSNHWTTVGQLETGRDGHAVLSIGPELLPCFEEPETTTTPTTSADHDLSGLLEVGVAIVEVLLVVLG